ncbi:hypothetical protein [Actinoplanes sp. TFC3]|uniref:hypothetical protein n=1 Tax=Actinoplanes sp. TFC3 TaxID=1710355 RepID=UPI0008367EFC|nr:hypothetical protein [Actinoplanes sp. TFC3]
MTPRRADLTAAGAALALVALASAVAAVLHLSGRSVHASAAPFTAVWRPHAGPGTPLTLIVAASVIRYGPRLAATLPWRRLLLSTYGAAFAWIVALALVDGWQRGVAGRLTTRHEYLSQVAGAGPVPTLLRGFANRIADFQPDSWTTHVAGHPPGAFLVFVGLDRIGLRGGAWAACVCMAVAALAAVAVPVTLRALGSESDARTAVPFLVLFPGAVWLGVSADGLFTGVAATGLALLALCVTRRAVLAGLAAGLLLGFAVYLSYGLTLLGVLALGVLLAARRLPPWPVLAGAGIVVLAFTLAGFWWIEGYQQVTVRYYQGIARLRPYGYWVWANLALVVVSAGPASAVMLRRAALNPRRGLLALAALTAILLADLSGFSKAEVERIWLPFLVWLLAGAALLAPATRRGWLIAQAAVAILVNHLLLTTW